MKLARVTRVLRDEALVAALDHLGPRLQSRTSRRLGLAAEPPPGRPVPGP
jgi:hypothetical protein